MSSVATTADATYIGFSSGGENQFDVRATGGISLVTNIDGSGKPLNGLYVANDGTTALDGLRVGGGGPFRQMQAGTADVGASASNLKLFAVTFPVAFAAMPHVIATTRAQPDPNLDFNDNYVVSTRHLTTSYAVFNIQRVDQSTNSGQDLQLDWFAWR